MSGWRPRLVALDIDGTLLKWVEGVGTTYEQISPPVYDAVHRALAAGAHVVLASGRSPHGMTRIADLLDLHAAGARTGVVSSKKASTVELGLREDEIVVGTGGGVLRAFRKQVANSEFRQAGVSGVLRLTLHPVNYDWEFLPVNGDVADSGSTPCH